jgi:DNA-binding CsgD family transcriptional regulator
LARDVEQVHNCCLNLQWCKTIGASDNTSFFRFSLDDDNTCHQQKYLEMYPTQDVRLMQNAELAALVETLQAVCRDTKVPITAGDANYRRIFSNRAHDDLVEYDERAFLRERGPFPWTMEGSAEYLARQQPSLTKKLRGTRIRVLLATVRDRSGIVLPILRTNTRIRSNDGGLLAWIGFLIPLSHGDFPRSIPASPESIEGITAVEIELSDYLKVLSGCDQQESHRLTLREREVVDYLSSGFAPKEIARALFITEPTVRNHLKSVRQKFGVSSTRKLLVKVRQTWWSGDRQGPR